MTKERVRHAFRQLLEEQPDIGIAKILSTSCCEPRHRFDPNARKSVKPEILLVAVYLVLIAAVCVIFNYI